MDAIEGLAVGYVVLVLVLVLVIHGALLSAGFRLVGARVTVGQACVAIVLAAIVGVLARFATLAVTDGGAAGTILPSIVAFLVELAALASVTETTMVRSLLAVIAAVMLTLVIFFVFIFAISILTAGTETLGEARLLTMPKLLGETGA